MPEAIYLDHHATTPLDPRVLEAMLPAMRTVGNASSTHPYGWAANALVDTTRRQVASLVDCEPGDVVFTSGATEAANLLLLGLVAHARRRRGIAQPRVVTVATEHPAILDVCAALEARGEAEIVRLPVDECGHLDRNTVAAALAEEPSRTVLLAVMAANNEIGTRHDLGPLVELAAKHDVPVYSDAVQQVGKLPFSFRELGLAAAGLSAHKLYGPQGIGALILRPALRRHVEPLLHGGGQEAGLRPGTLNVPGIIGLGAACEIAQAEMADEARHTATLRDRLWQGLQDRIAPVLLNGDPDPAGRLPSNLNVSIPFVDGEQLHSRLTQTLAISSGSACASSKLTNSHVLHAIGRTESQAAASLRFGLGRGTTAAEIDAALDTITATVTALRAIHPLWELHEAGLPTGRVDA